MQNTETTANVTLTLYRKKACECISLRQAFAFAERAERMFQLAWATEDFTPECMGVIQLAIDKVVAASSATAWDVAKEYAASLGLDTTEEAPTFVKNTEEYWFEVQDRVNESFEAESVESLDYYDSTCEQLFGMLAHEFVETMMLMEVNAMVTARLLYEVNNELQKEAVNS